MVRAYGLSDAGVSRERNEDRFESDIALQAFVVADGLGGHAGGIVASRLAVETVLAFLRRTKDPDPDLDWPFGFDLTLSLDANRLKTAVRLANRRILSVAASDPDLAGMGSTVVAILIGGGTLVAAHVGDSRLYLLESQGFVRLTRDDSWIETVPTPPASRPGRHPLGHLLTQALGSHEDVVPTLLERPLRGGELLLLCTDGLHGVLSDDMLRHYLDPAGDLALMVKSMLVAALNHETTDNVTALLVAYESEPPLSRSE
jgi:protein phosphatase